MPATRFLDIVNSGGVQQLQAPRALTQSLTSATLDMQNYDGNCVAVLNVGDVSGTGGPTLNVTIQEGDGTTWTEVRGPDGTAAGAFPQATTNTYGQRAILFQRSQRYLRAVQVVGGTTSPNFVASVSVIEELKTLLT